MGGRDKGKLVAPKREKGKLGAPERERETAGSRFWDPIPLVNQTARRHARTHAGMHARTHARSARHGTKRFPSWTHPPTSDYCMFLISVSVLSWRDEWAIITGPNMPILRFRGDSLVAIANLPCRGPIEPKRGSLPEGGGGGPGPPSPQR